MNKVFLSLLTSASLVSLFAATAVDMGVTKDQSAGVYQPLNEAQQAAATAISFQKSINADVENSSSYSSSSPVLGGTDQTITGELKIKSGGDCQLRNFVNAKNYCASQNMRLQTVEESISQDTAYCTNPAWTQTPAGAGSFFTYTQFNRPGAAFNANTLNATVCVR